MMRHMTRKIRAKNIAMDKKGGIEGLPLQLMILVLIAGIGSAVMIGWTSNLKSPMSISSVTEPGQIELSDLDHNGVFENDNIDLIIHVVDQNGNGIEGVVVVLDGCNIATSDGSTVYGTTDQNGKVMLSSLQASHVGGKLGFISISATKSGFGMDGTYSLPVICG
jgi:hypothetical protein